MQVFFSISKVRHTTAAHSVFEFVIYLQLPAFSKCNHELLEIQTSQGQSGNPELTFCVSGSIDETRRV